MKSAADTTFEVACFLMWLAGFLTGLLSDNTGNRVVGMLVWIGLGVGYRLRKIQENTTPVKQ